jgi:hypothetical protein
VVMLVVEWQFFVEMEMGIFFVCFVELAEII